MRTTIKTTKTTINETSEQKFRRKLATFKDIGKFARNYRITITENPDIPCQPNVYIGQKGLPAAHYGMITARFIAMYEDARHKLIKLDIPCGNIAGIIKNTIRLSR